jgi:hypothetical protein
VISFRRFSVRALLALTTISALLLAWGLHPRHSADSLADAIRSMDATRVEQLVADKSLHRMVTGGRYDPGNVHLQCARRTASEFLCGRQSFMISGYGGTHRFIVVRGKIDYIRQTWFFGGFELTR